MDMPNYQSWISGINSWLQQPGQNTQANVEALRAQAKSIGLDPGVIGDPGSAPPPVAANGKDPGAIGDPGSTSPYLQIAVGKLLPPPAYEEITDAPPSYISATTDSPPPYMPATGDNSKPGPAGGKYDELIEAAAAKYKVSSALIKAVIEQESRGDPNAVNPTSGCTGLMQLKPEYFGQDGADLTDPATNIDRGTKELARLLKVKGGDEVAALAAYNLGEYANIDSTVPGQNGLTGRQYATEVLAKF